MQYLLTFFICVTCFADNVNGQPAAGTRKTVSSATFPGAKEKTVDSIVYDLDSNRYHVVQIGKQYWLRENLRTTRYTDTTRIAGGLGNEDWAATKTGAWSVYNNDLRNDSLYGKLYNGYAVRTGRLCPAGWRIPTDKDWKELEAYLGVDLSELDQTGTRGNAGHRFKGGNYWKPSTYPASNESGLLVLPAGSRNHHGEYENLGQYGNFWTASVYDDRYGLYLWNRHFHYESNGTGRIYTPAVNGYSCRCIKATETKQEKENRK